MGVPKFYRWLSERYPMINQVISDSSMLPEVDNFYLDMNGIIHNCSHPNDDAANNTLTEREMMLGIFRYINRCVSEIVKPKKVLFMAIDGVAPRAKMNQQRSRRFRAAQEREENIEKAKAAGEVVDEDSLFDSNCITPGTAFMDRVGRHIRYFIRKKVKEDPLWQSLEIVFSGHDVPGEGEHKIMQYIRDARSKPGYSPNTRHCMYGQDADLIMLGLCTHEPHFVLLREVIDFGGGRGGGGAKQVVVQQTEEAKFQLLHLATLREYIEVDLALGCEHALDVERLVDDFVFLTFLVGNDFLPHLPTLDIGEQAFDVIFKAYRDLLAQLPGYIVGDGEIKDMHRFEILCQKIGQQESEILEAREESMTKQAARRSKGRKNFGPAGPTLEEMEEAEEAAAAAYQAAFLEAQGMGDMDASQKAPAPAVGTSEIGDDVAQKDYHGRYYFSKFKVIPGSSKGNDLMAALTKSYLEGLAWCLAYYCRGCISWTWYFPYHYGPMLMDLRGLTPVYSSISFELGQPFLPFQQLLGCLPPLSAKLLPKPYQKIMLDPILSDVIEFYPKEFAIDMNGKKAPWEAVVILPFIDEERLMEAERKVCPASKLTEEEKKRNSVGTVCQVRYDPLVLETYYSCNPEIGLPDIHRCNTRCTFYKESFAPGKVFEASLIPGTRVPYPGFPSLGVIPMEDIRTEAVKMNVFGSDSRYQSIILQMQAQTFDVTSMDFSPLVGRSVWVNFPQIHEALVVGASTEHGEWRKRAGRRATANKAVEMANIGNGKNKRLQVTKDASTQEAAEEGPVEPEVVYRVYDKFETKSWQEYAKEEEFAYRNGRGIPGTGGVDIGPVQVRLRVRVLQGMKHDPMTGASTKVFGSSEAEIPIQMALFDCPCPDPRFQERDSAPLSVLLPEDSEVVAVSGPVRGLVGRVRHGSTPAANTNEARKVDVEFVKVPQEPAFGHAIAQTLYDEYYNSKDVARVLQLSPSVLGKVMGAIFIADNRMDIGLNLKRGGAYCMNGFSRMRELDEDGRAMDVGALKSWDKQDTVHVVGQSREDIVPDEGGGFWEYTDKAVAVVAEYKAKFPMLFENLATLPHAPKYDAKKLFPQDTANMLKAVDDFLRAQPCYNKARTPLSTITLSPDAVKAIERAADVRRSKNMEDDDEAGGPDKILARGVPLDMLFRGGHFTSTDAPLVYNDGLHPTLGDRIVNLTSTGVPFGLRGTVVTIHKHTKYVEVVFDEEFIGGKALAGLCSPFRGRLVPWAGVLCLSTQSEQMSVDAAMKKAKKTSKAVDKLSGITLEAVPRQNKSNVALSKALKKSLKIGDAAAKPPTSEAEPVQATTEPEPLSLRSDGSGLKALLSIGQGSGAEDEDNDVSDDFASNHLLRAPTQPAARPTEAGATMAVMGVVMSPAGPVATPMIVPVLPPAPPTTVAQEQADTSQADAGDTADAGDFPALGAEGPMVPVAKAKTAAAAVGGQEARAPRVMKAEQRSERPAHKVTMTSAATSSSSSSSSSSNRSSSYSTARTGAAARDAATKPTPKPTKGKETTPKPKPTKGKETKDVPGSKKVMKRPESTTSAADAPAATVDAADLTSMAKAKAEALKRLLKKKVEVLKGKTAGPSEDDATPDAIDDDEKAAAAAAAKAAKAAKAQQAAEAAAAAKAEKAEADRVALAQKVKALKPASLKVRSKK